MDLIRRNFGLKVSAVVIAIGLWFAFNYLTASQTYSTTLEIPVVLHGVAPGLVATTNTQDVTIQLAGPRSVLEKLAPADFAAYLDCAGKEAGVLSLNIAVAGPESDKIRSVSPAAAIVVLDRYGYRTVPVISADNGQSVIVTNVEPKSVIVAGAETALAKVMAVRVSIEDTTATKPVTVTVRPVPVDVNFLPVPGVSVAPPSVRVAIMPHKAPG
jgi:YbbR domain-containing protein